MSARDDKLIRSLHKACIHWKYLSLLLILLLALSAIWIPVQAQAQARVQELSGVIDPGGQAVYLLSDLKQGQHLYVYVETTSGNLDPIAALIDPNADIASLSEAYQTAVDEAVRQKLDPSQAIDALRDQYSLVWDDDSGEGYAAAFEYEVPQDGDYQLLISGALSSLGRATFGSYRLLAGLNAPQVLTGIAEPSGEPFTSLDLEIVQSVVRVQEIGGSITQEEPIQRYNLKDLNPGDVLYAYVEATSGDLNPILLLRDYGDKPLTAGNLSGEAKTASLQHPFSERGENIVLDVYAGDPAGPARQGDYRLLLGINQPDVLAGSAEVTELPVLRQPIEVQIGVKLQQIIDVNFQDEFFSVVASMRMEWTDPALAFSPDTCQCKSKVYTEKEFDSFLADVKGRWPDFTLFDQQGNRWVQNRVVVLEPDGSAIYFERFSTNLQVDFDFRRFPLDVQQFRIRIDSLYPQDFYYFSDLEGFSEISPEHGEDEFIITGFDTEISSEQGSAGSLNSRFSFLYEAPRHLNYYILQVFVPILLIVLISWWTFFLKDYTQRIEVAAGNVLLFIAFSFSLAENYPRLGYMTFMDAIMAMIFIVNALVLIYNVYLRRLEMADQSEQADRIDRVMDWMYPLLYFVAVGVVYYIFFIATPPA
jgi:hypothetical protein